MNIIVAGCGKIGESIIKSLVSENLNITAIDTNTNVINEITNIYDVIGVHGNAADCETLLEAGIGKAEALEFNVAPDSDVINIPLKELELKPNILIAGIIRGRKTIIPSGDDSIIAGDRVIILAGNQRLQDLSDILK